MSSTLPPPDKQDEMADTEQPFMEHLIELRTRLVRACIAIAVVTGCLLIWPGAEKVFNFLAEPLTSILKDKIVSINVISPFMTQMKVVLMAALLMSLPFVLYQVWSFVAPGLYRSEKRLIVPLVVSSVTLFYLGVAFCYYFVFGKVFAFMISVAPASIAYTPDMDSFVSFALTLFLAFGLAFEVPIAVVLLVRMGVVTVKKLASIRAYVIVGAFVVSALVTPPDVLSQFLLAVPMCILYEVGLWAARFVSPKDTDEDTSQEAASAS